MSQTMSNRLQGPPAADEHNPYYSKYLVLVPETDFLPAFEAQTEAGLGFLRGIPESKGSHRYAPDKWSIKQSLGHVVDTERVFAFRALAFARGDAAKIPGMDQEIYMQVANFDEQSMADLVRQFELVRRGNLAFFGSLTPEAWMRRGTASDNEVSVRALAYIILGHERHHWKLFKEKYLA